MQTWIIRRAGLCALLLTLCGAAQARDFRIGLITPPGHQWTVAAEAFAAAVARRYPDKHRVLVYPSRQLGTEAQMLQLLQTGALDFAILTVSELSNRLPRFGALYSPYLVADAAEGAALLRSPEARALLEQLPRELGVVGAGYAMAGMRQILSREPLDRAAQLSGTKLRITPFAPVRDFYQLLGAAPTPMPLSSVFDALANGQIDAIDMDLESIWKLRYYHYGDTLLLSNHMLFPAVGLMSARSWLRQPEGLRAQLLALLRAELDAVLSRYPQLEREWRAQLADTGLQLRPAGPAFFGAVPEAWRREWRPRAPQLTDLERAVARLRGAGAGEANAQ